MEISCIIAWTGIGIIIIAFLWLAIKSNLLRDQVDNPVALQNTAPLKFRNKVLSQIPLSFSLSRTQMAIWTVVISCSMLYVFLCKDCPFTGVNATALALMGISVATAATAGAVDKSQIDAAAANPAMPARHQNMASKGFFYDILSDENGISIHRFQHVIWTLVSIAIYLWMVARGNNTGSNSCLPTLDPTLLVLQGISSAGYLSLKLKENQSPSVSNAALSLNAAGHLPPAPTPAPVPPAVHPAPDSNTPTA